jgi:hypothetical protein
MINGPDFICVGMPKAGTGWLYDQLDAHPDFWMPPAKELVYLGQKFPKLRFVDDQGEARHPKQRRAGKRGASPGQKQSQGDRQIQRPLRDSRDIEFLKYAGSCRGERMDLDRYAALFRFKGELLSGDITPPYCNLREETIWEIADHFPHVKIILLIRNPVARAWSRICMSHEAGKFDPALLQEADHFRSFLRGSHKVGALSAAATFMRWRTHAPALELRTFFFDAIQSEPDKVRHEILTFLGADPEKQGAAISPEYNRKGGYAKLPMSELAEAVLIEHFRHELQEGAELFGGSAAEWATRYGL